VFGPLTTMASEDSADKRAAIMKQHQLNDYRLPTLPLPGENPQQTLAREKSERNEVISRETARSWAWVAFLDIVVFFGVLMVGFAYLWRRGDIDWVRSVTHSASAQPATDVLMPSPHESEVAVSRQLSAVSQKTS